MRPTLHRSTTSLSAATILMMVAMAYANQCFSQELDSTARSRKAKELFISGTTLQIQGNRHAEAIIDFQQSLRYDSSSVTLAAMARSYREIKKLDLAFETVNLALARDKSSRDAWELLAEIEIMRGRYDEGLSAYEKILDLAPTKRQMFMLARLYEPRNAQRAIEILESIVAKWPDDVVMYMRLNDLYERTKDTKSRLRVLEQAARLAPKDPQIAAAQCELYIEQAQFDELTSLLRRWDGKAIDPDMSSEVWLVTLSSALEDSLIIGLHRDDVRHIAELATSSMSSSWPVMVVAGTVAISCADTALAATCFSTILQNQQVIAEGFLEVGRVYAMNEMQQRSLEFLSMGRVRFPTDIRFPVVMSSLHMDMGNDRQAIIELETASLIDSSAIDIWVQLGMLYDRTKRLQESDQAYERALLLDQSNALANNNYAYSLSLRHLDLDRAKAMSERAVSADTSNAAFLDTYAWILYQREDYAKAKEFILKAIQFGGNATHYEHYGMILRALGERSEAINAFERSLEIDPTRTWVRDELEMLTK